MAFRLTLLFLVFTFLSKAQVDTIIDEVLIEEYIENNDLEGEFAYSEIGANLSYYTKHPINLNKASKEDFEDFGFLSDIQINALLDYRTKYGDLITVYELQAVPGFTLDDINKIRSYIQVFGEIDDLSVPFKNMFLEGSNEVIVRFARQLQDSDGYLQEKIDDGKGFLGSPYLFYTRYKHQFGNRFKFGVTAEKDYGEEFFKGSNKQGFDYYSFHFYLKNYNKRIKAIAIGDYTVKLGQGLMLFNGFGLAKGSDVLGIRKTSIPINSYSGVGENVFYRGAATTIGLSKSLQLTLFGSSTSRDANILEPDSLAIDDDEFFSSFQLSGYHRTPSEIVDEDVLRHNVVGGSIKYKKNKGHIAFNAVHNRFDKSLTIKTKLYNQFYFQGDRLSNMSVDYSFVHKNIMLFGESGMSDNGAMAHLAGANLSLDRRVSMSAIYRDLGVAYQAIDASVFGASTRANNLKAMYFGLQIIPNYNWKLSGYLDILDYPWLRYTTASPSVGYDYLFRVDYKKKRKFTAYVKFRVVNSMKNIKHLDTEEKVIGTLNLYRLRFHISNIVLPNLEFRNRFEFSVYDDGINANQTGYLVYQDVIWKRVMQSRLALTGRFAIFDTGGYNSRLYAYESDVQGSNYIPAYQNKGIRTYLKASYKGIRGLTIETRYALFWYDDINEISSGINRVDGNVKSEIKLQFIYRW